MKDINERKFISIQAKISPEAAGRLDGIVEKYGFKSRYEIMQCLLEAFLRYTDPGYTGGKDTSLSEIYDLHKIWEGVENKKNRVITVGPRQKGKALRLAGSVMLFNQEGSKGYCCRYMTFRGEDTHITSNNNDILKSIMYTLFPAIYTALHRIGENIGCTRIDYILEYLLHEASPQIKDGIAGEIRREFARNTSYQETNYGDVPKRARETTIDGMFPEDVASRCDEEEEMQTEEVYGMDYEEEPEE